MKRILLSLVAIATLSLSSFGQAPEGFKYQAVVRDAGNLILNNQAVGMQMTIQQGSIGGTTVYQETFTPTTNSYGLVNLEIGSGTVVTGDFAIIDWANGPYFIETAVDVTGGTSYAVMGTSELMSVPYALHATTAETAMTDLVDDADADPANELITDVSLNGTSLDITEAGVTASTDLSSLQDGVIDADADPTNEIQTMSVSNLGDTLFLSQSNFVIIPGISLKNFGNYQAHLDAGYSPCDLFTMGAPLDSLYGRVYEGGIIFYLNMSNCTGLLAAPNDYSAEWGCQPINVGGTSFAIGTGESNTQAIISGCTTPGIAALVCSDLILGVYDDWYLPSADEMVEMANIIGNNGGFIANWYWTSSECGAATDAYSVVPTNGNATCVMSKLNVFNFRPVRSF